MKRKLGAILLVVALVLSMSLIAAPAALAWQEGGGTDWYYVDASYGDYHNSVPLVIELGGNSSAGQIFYVGETITISGYLHAVAQSCGGDGNGAYTEWHLEVDGPTGPASTTGSNYDSSSGCAVADEDTTLSITYTLTATGTHTVYMSSYAAVSQYWTDVADDYVDASLTFEVEFFSVPLCAGQHIDVGTVTVWEDGTNLHVKYETTDGWLMTETHLHVAEDWKDIPQTQPNKKGKGGGNPIPGHFDENVSFDPPTDSWSVTYNLETKGWVGCETDLVIAAHAVVIGPSGDCEDPFWATGQSEYTPGQNWAGGDVPYGVTYYSADQKMTGAPDVDYLGPPMPQWNGFQSLGFGGSVVITFDKPIFNGPGEYDISVHEITGLDVAGRESYPEESATVSIWVNNGWEVIGTVTSHDDYDGDSDEDGIGTVSIPEEYLYVEKIKITDTTDVADFSFMSDGYDVDAVDACFIYNLEETAWAGGKCDTKPNVQDFPGANWATYFTYHVMLCNGEE